MNINAIPVGKNPPWDINVIIENGQGGVPVKYEVDKDSGALFADRFMFTSMVYPTNYGFLPHTLAGDGDPCDALLLAPLPVIPGAVVRSRPIGVLDMEDEAGPDEKLVFVPVDTVHPFYADYKSPEDMPRIQRDQIVHFFERYKDLEEGKWVKVKGWGDAERAAQLITEGIDRYKAEG